MSQAPFLIISLLMLKHRSDVEAGTVYNLIVFDVGKASST